MEALVERANKPLPPAVEVTEVTEVTLRGVEAFFAGVVTKFGTGAKIGCPKRFLGHEVFVIIRRGTTESPGVERVSQAILTRPEAEFGLSDGWSSTEGRPLASSSIQTPGVEAVVSPPGQRIEESVRESVQSAPGGVTPPASAHGPGEISSLTNSGIRTRESNPEGC
jgi:putative transposon-encoded protein